jgi:putative zinc finger protein/HEAT repeat protein
MNCARVKELSTDYITGELPGVLRAQIENHLAECASCREETRSSQAIWAKLSALPPVEPSPAMDARFEAMLASHTRGLGSSKAVASPLQRLIGCLEALWPPRPAWQFGIAILLFCLGLFLGNFLALLRPGALPSNAANERTLTQLREDVAGLKQMVTLSLLQQQSASERLRGVEWSQQLNAPDEQVLRALLAALDSDPNVNVRLAAIEALEQFASRAAIRQGLLAALPRQNSPLVQLELIRLFVELNEKDSVPVLRALLQDRQLNPTVRERAEWGLEQLT